MKLVSLFNIATSLSTQSHLFTRTILFPLSGFPWPTTDQDRMCSPLSHPQAELTNHTVGVIHVQLSNVFFLFYPHVIPERLEN